MEKLKEQEEEPEEGQGEEQDVFEIHLFIKDKPTLVKRAPDPRLLLAGGIDNVRRIDLYAVSPDEPENKQLSDYEKQERLVAWFDENPNGYWAQVAKNNEDIKMKQLDKRQAGEPEPLKPGQQVSKWEEKERAQIQPIRTPWGDVSINEVNLFMKNNPLMPDNTMKEMENLEEKSVSTSQQQAAGAALAAKRGEIPVSDLKGSSKEMYDSMSEKQLEDFARTKHKGLPEKVEEGAVQEKWSPEVKVKDTGENTNKTIEQLKKEKAAATDKSTVAQKNFAIRAKQRKDKWGKIHEEEPIKEGDTSTPPAVHLPITTMEHKKLSLTQFITEEISNEQRANPEDEIKPSDNNAESQAKMLDDTNTKDRLGERAQIHKNIALRHRGVDECSADKKKYKVTEEQMKRLNEIRLMRESMRKMGAVITE